MYLQSTLPIYVMLFSMCMVSCLCTFKESLFINSLDLQEDLFPHEQLGNRSTTRLSAVYCESTM
jgi:hypothetical protein